MTETAKDECSPSSSRGKFRAKIHHFLLH
ncbi:hypothetical protein FRACA_2040006 [Frankia canadensis]|uniref:Uncharacterized protein n=1 Tax=Frankia canadensis TaxID=1836972 RepID=A0A2I2KQC7_9ACTN|nr:hypothetical protein FRACA_2040006 [Frankia canadensis]SOU55149.1 hypothetical protein FRACA_2040006 [Frankia canadensis]